MRYTPENINDLSIDEIFVFGSNLKGQHGGGAAKLAMKFGAKWGKGIGLAGNTYAIPTKEDFRRSLTVDEIRPFVDQFILFAKESEDYVFLVTKIGCGLAGHSVENIAPLFERAKNISNIILPKEFY